MEIYIRRDRSVVDVDVFVWNFIHNTIYAYAHLLDQIHPKLTSYAYEIMSMAMLEYRRDRNPTWSCNNGTSFGWGHQSGGSFRNIIYILTRPITRNCILPMILGGMITRKHPSYGILEEVGPLWTLNLVKMARHAGKFHHFQILWLKTALRTEHEYTV